MSEPMCRERRRLLGLPYPKSNCDKCGPLIRPGWRCSEEAGGDPPRASAAPAPGLAMTLAEAYVLHRHHEDAEKECAVQRAYAGAEAHRTRAAEIGRAFWPGKRD